MDQTIEFRCVYKCIYSNLDTDHSSNLDTDHSSNLDTYHSSNLDTDHSSNLDTDHSSNLDTDHSSNLDTDHSIIDSTLYQNTIVYRMGFLQLDFNIAD